MPEPETPSIRIRGARTHNLKNIDLDLPRNRLVVITGLSGSGKSSLAFDTLYAEGQRRYVESLSAYARQFLQLMDKPDVDVIEGLSPAISIEQKATSHNPRSTVGTVTEIHDYLRLLYARAGTPFCPDHELPLQAQSVSQMVDAVLALPDDTRLMVLAPVVRDRKGEFAELFADMQAQGYVRFRVDGSAFEAADLPRLKKAEKHDIDVVIDRVKVHRDLHDSLRQRLAESFEAALRIADGRALALEMERPASRAQRDAGPRRAPLQQQVRLPGVQLLAVGDGAAPVLVQLAGRRLPGLRRARRGDGVRPRARGRLPEPEPGQRRGQGLGPAQRLHVLDARERGPPLRIRHRYRRSKRCPRARSRRCCAARARPRSSSSTRPKAPSGRKRSVRRSHPFEGIIPNLERRYKETDSVAVREDLARYMASKPCPDCDGARLRREARHVFLVDAGGDECGTASGRPIYDVEHATLRDCLAYFDGLRLAGAKAEIADKVVREIRSRLKFLNDVGLDYLSLDRNADTLSGGESQRIRLASQIGSGLTGVMYVLDEPSIGLHQRDNARLIGTLRHLRDLGNSVLVVEHDEEAIRAADHCIDMGPGAGVHGGRVIAQGTPDEVAANPAVADRALPVGRAEDRGAGSADARSPTAPIGRRCRSAMRAATTCAASTSRSRSACSPASPASRARARARWSTTRCTRPSRASSTTAMPSRRRTTRSRASKRSTR